MKTFIKAIKSATSKEQLQHITKDALGTASITMKQYNKLILYAVCREIELSNPTTYLLYPWILMTHEQRTEIMKDLIDRGLAIDATKK